LAVARADAPFVAKHSRVLLLSVVCFAAAADAASACTHGSGPSSASSCAERVPLPRKPPADIVGHAGAAAALPLPLPVLQRAGPSSHFSVELAGRERAHDPLATRVEDGVGTQLPGRKRRPAAGREAHVSDAGS
jgi:hypothetical protein